MFPWRIFVWLFRYQFLRCIEHLFHCEIFCFFDGVYTVWLFLHHENRDACNVEVTNIHHITECLSLSFVHLMKVGTASFALDRSFTLCKNDLDLNGISDSASVSEFILSFSTMNLSVCCATYTGLHVLTSINSSDFHSWEDQCVSAFHSGLAWWVSVFNKSPCSLMLLSSQALRKLTFMSCFPRTLWCSGG